MYRIEVKPGEESVFRTIEELATAIRNGLVTPRARIYHNASQKWLPIEFHPHYKKALQLPKTNSGENPVVVSSPPATAHQPSKAHEPPKPHEPAKSPQPAKSQDSFKSLEPVKPVDPPKVQQAPKPPEPVTKTRELEIVYTPPVEARAPAVKPAPVAPPPTPAAPVRPPPVASAPVPKPAAIQPPAPKAAAPESHSPVVELPTIDYPETTPIESLIPVASASKARTASGRRRPMVLGTAVAVLIAGAYVGLSGAMPAHEAAADNGPIPGEPVHQLAVAPVAVPDSSMKGAMKAPVIKAPVVTAATSSSGPTFGPPSSPAPAPKRQIVSSIGATTPAAPRAPAKDSVEAIEPAPVDVDVSVPSVPAGDSLAPVVRSDSNAIGKILRAVGGKGSSSRP